MGRQTLPCSPLAPVSGLSWSTKGTYTHPELFIEFAVPMWLCLSSVHQSLPLLLLPPHPGPHSASPASLTGGKSVLASCQARIPGLGVLPQSSVIPGTPHTLFLLSLRISTMWDPDCLRSLCACGGQFAPPPPAVSWPGCLGMGPQGHSCLSPWSQAPCACVLSVPQASC